MGNRKSLAAFLRAARNRAGLSQRDVALRLGYGTPQFISNWERGISSPPCRAVHTLAELYRVSADELYDALVEETLMRVEQDLREEFYGAAAGGKGARKPRRARRA